MSRTIGTLVIGSLIPALILNPIDKFKAPQLLSADRIVQNPTLMFDRTLRHGNCPDMWKMAKGSIPMDKKTAVKKALVILESFQEAGRKYQNINGDEKINDRDFGEMLAALRGMEQDMHVKHEGEEAVQKAACDLKDKVQARSDELKVTPDDFEGNFKKEVIGDKVRDIVGSSSAAEIADHGLKHQIAALMKHHGIARTTVMVEHALAEYLACVADRAKP